MLLSDYSHYTLTFDHIFSGANNYGLGIRFFGTAKFTPLNLSFGFFAYYDTHDEIWLGIDTHVVLFRRTELHVGLSLVKLEDATHTNIRPNIGLGFKLF